jgi:hypothetical protein
MKKLRLLILLLLLSGPCVHAQELAFAYTPTTQIKSFDLASVPHNLVMPPGNRKKGVVCLITGGVLIVGGIQMLALASHADPGESSPWGPAGVACVSAGIVTFVVGGFMFLASGPGGNGHYSSHISAYDDPNHVGLAYNF